MADTLTNITVNDIIKDQDALHVVRFDDDIKTVLDTLNKYNIQSVPVVDMECNCYGILSNVDLLDFLVRVSSSAKESSVTPNSTHLQDDDFFMSLERSQDWKHTTIQQAFGIGPLSKEIHSRQPFLPITEGAPITAALPLFERGAHRIPVVKKNSKLVTHLLTQSSVNAFLADRPELLGKRGNMTLTDLGLIKGIDNVRTTDEKTKAIDAFTYMRDNELTSLAIVNGRGALQGVISASDLKMVDFKCRQLLLPVLEFVKSIRQEELQTKSYTVWCRADATLANVVKQMAGERVHRVYVLNDYLLPISVVSLSDVAKVLSKEFKQ